MIRFSFGWVDALKPATKKTKPNIFGFKNWKPKLWQWVSWFRLVFLVCRFCALSYVRGFQLNKDKKFISDHNSTIRRECLSKLSPHPLDLLEEVKVEFKLEVQDPLYICVCVCVCVCVKVKDPLKISFFFFSYLLVCVMMVLFECSKFVPFLGGLQQKNEKKTV